MKKTIAILTGISLLIASSAYADIKVVNGQKNFPIGHFFGRITNVTIENGKKSTIIRVNSTKNYDYVDLTLTGDDAQNGLAFAALVDKTIDLGATQIGNDLVIVKYVITK